ncbi:unnamed protein product [Penicillium pancosmium]
MANAQVAFPAAADEGKLITISAVERRANDDSRNPWTSVPVNDQDLSQGYKDISFRQLNNYTNHAAHWLSENLPPSSEPFQSFAYAGPKDLRYPILALAAAKLQKVIVLPSPLITPDAQTRILNAKNCGLYLRTPAMAEPIAAVLKEAPHVQVITVPDLSVFLNEDTAPKYTYSKSWEEAKDDPWVVFHTSGTTGYPKPLTYTQYMMAMPGVVASIPGMEECWVGRYSNKRLYTPLPSLHLVGMIFILGLTTFNDTVIVVGPSAPPTPQNVLDVIKYGKVDSALLTPALIEEICLSQTGLDTLRSLAYVQYAGAPLAAKAGNLLASHTNVTPTIGSTEAGGYMTKMHGKKDAWDYISFHERAGAVFEQRFDDLHELVFVRQPDDRTQSIFKLYTDRDRYPTNDLWIEHPVYKGLWKIIGRADDHVSFSHGEGLHASRLEPEIEAHPAVKSALIGGHGYSAPVLLLELYTGTVDDSDRASFLAALQSHIDKVNAQVHQCVALSADRIIIAAEDKPFVRTVKGSVGRVQTLAAYKDEIAALFAESS